MIYKGIFEIEVNGEKKGFKTGTLASAFFCQEEGITLNQMANRLQDPSPMTAINLGYAASKAFHHFKQIPFKHTKEEIADWIDEVGIVEFLKMVLDSMITYQPKGEEEKNALAPSEGQIGR